MVTMDGFRGSGRIMWDRGSTTLVTDNWRVTKGELCLHGSRLPLVSVTTGLRPLISGRETESCEDWGVSTGTAVSEGSSSTLLCLLFRPSPRPLHPFFRTLFSRHLPHSGFRLRFETGLGTYR